MVCKKCNAENLAEQKFCGECGAKLEPMPQPISVEGEPGAFYCSRHKKEITRLRCGRCETPICTRCAVHGPAGVRCRDCARNRVPVRPMGVLHEVSRSLDNGAQGVGRTVWYLAIWAIVIGFIRNLFGGSRDF